ncbi:MAG: hypothetical protein UU42_C0012G0017 [Candidatus Woesebacteria bacterium GW2011_GWA1_41_13b]|uniref:Uncharacterized protein n=1 Tax=Candidatus Woesebacteria bacterium GW2011_GWA1_41_13b TaxID=1618555 RepID=A0A0G0X405_9BACT|nr:MAG: hypothetical protein UU42_C0012G0017 [Candidatus Woesebacteria bacterium GW2011_GWA1_41_13b]
MWDYHLTNGQVLDLLRTGNETQRLWLTGKIISHARFEDIWNYLTPANVASLYPKLRLQPTLKKYWGRALNAWGYYVQPAK